MSKEMYINTLETMIEERVERYLEHNPDATEDQIRLVESEAYDNMADRAYDRMREDLAERGDWERLRRKERQLERDLDFAERQIIERAQRIAKFEPGE
jgi:predicted glycosyl hydrolase (DUF1957 family)